MARSADKKLNIIVLTVERQVYNGQADIVTVPAVDGELTIMPDHIALITPLGVGVLGARDGEKDEIVALHAGFLKVEDDDITVLADAAERAADIDVQRAMSAKQRAEDMLARTDAAGVELEAAGAALRRALLRLRVAGWIRY